MLELKQQLSTADYPHPVVCDRSGTRFEDFSIPIPVGWRGIHGAELPGESIHLRFAGAVSGPRILILGGISGGRHVAREPFDIDGWWGDLACPDGVVDLDQCQVIGADYPPKNTSGEAKLCPEDIADLLYFALTKTGLKKIDTLIGCSFGGMIALAFARKYGAFLDTLCVIAAAHNPAPMARAWRVIQRQIIAFSIDAGRSETGVNLARQLAMTTYRTPEEFAARFTNPADVDDYLSARGRAYSESVSADRYLTLSAAIDRHAEEPENIRTPALFIGIDSDRLTPLSDIGECHQRYGGPSSLAVIPSQFGHDGFLKETAAIGKCLKQFLNGENQ